VSRVLAEEQASANSDNILDRQVFENLCKENIYSNVNFTMVVICAVPA